MENEQKIIEERKKLILNFFKKNTKIWVYVALLLLLILGFYIRFQPLTDHGGNPGLWDATLDDYTLGPDLDPFLFLRYAREIIETGSLAQMDSMRYVPLGFDTTTELQMVSYMIVLTYKVLNIFGEYSINYAGAFMPVIFFLLTILSFFFFVREIFIRKDEKQSELKANLIALVSTLFMIILPEFLSRTVAGIPEKESVGFFFMFLAFFLFLKAWKTEKIIPASIISILAGIATALMGLTWGGVTYIYITIGLTSLILFILNKFNSKNALSYGLWLLTSFGMTLLFTNRFSIERFLFGIDTGLSFLVLGILIIHQILWKTKLKNILRVDRLKMPKTIVSIILVIVLGLLAILIINPSMIGERIAQVYHMLVKPVTGRWSTTVAENRQPYFTEWIGSFGTAIFWLFFIGSLLLFHKLFDKLKKKDNMILSGLYVLFFFGLVFSRYAAHPSLFDGENFISKFFYFGSAFLLIATLVYFYITYHKNNNFSFEKIETEYLFLFVLFILTLFTARSAVRLIMVLVPIAPIFLSYLLVDLGFKAKDKNSSNRTYVAILFIIILIASSYSAWSYYQSIQEKSYNFVPYYYTNQWQNAMSWVRESTPTDSVFAHWWDYGYWVQSIGNRATVTDGGNIITWWNYLTGRYVLTGDNQKQSLEFLWNHNATHLLIDSSDIGKYGAFSQIGSDENYDRLSQGPLTFLSSETNTKETKTGIQRIYATNAGGYMLDEDIVYIANGTSKELFKENSGIAGISIDYVIQGDGGSFSQPIGIFISNGKRIDVPLRYIYFQNKIYDFGKGIGAVAYVIQKVAPVNNQWALDEFGAVIYLSPRILRGFLGQVYILNDPFNNFQNFELVHTEKDIITNSFSQNFESLEDFVYYENYVGLQGPIKIWKINYIGDETFNSEYLLRDPPEYINWEF